MFPILIRLIVSKIPPLSFGIFGWRSQPSFHMGLARSAKLSRIRIILKQIVCLKIVNNFCLNCILQNGIALPACAVLGNDIRFTAALQYSPWKRKSTKWWWKSQLSFWRKIKELAILNLFYHLFQETWKYTESLWKLGNCSKIPPLSFREFSPKGGYLRDNYPDE